MTVSNVGIPANKYDKRIKESIKVKYSSLGRSSSITKLYAIKDNKHTILTVNLLSNSFGWSQRVDQEMSTKTSMGMKILNI